MNLKKPALAAAAGIALLGASPSFAHQPPQYHVPHAAPAWGWHSHHRHHHFPRRPVMVLPPPPVIYTPPPPVFVPRSVMVYPPAPAPAWRVSIGLRL